MPLHDPYAGADFGNALRANFHAHSTRSDGRSEPQAVIDAYADAGYDALMFSDHDVFTSAEDYRGWDARGMLLIPGCEVSAGGPHLLQIGGSEAVPPATDRQIVLDAIINDGGLAVMNHPNWFPDYDHCSQERLLELRGYLGLEIYNHVIGKLPGSPYALDRWDRLLSRGRRVWGFANDDEHDPWHVGHGWNVILAAERSVPSLFDALVAGRFYASTGVDVEWVGVVDGEAAIRAPDADRIVAIADHGRRVAVADGHELRTAIPDWASWMRFECWGRGERFAWTQPCFREDEA